MTISLERARPFFEYAREREAVRVRREEMGLPRPWTQDPVIDRYRFCNVYREDDATTRWFREWVRGPLSEKPEVLLATVVFRWFNRIATGDAIFRQVGDYTPNGAGSIRTAWEQYLLDKRTDSLRTAILQHCENGPYVTGAYIIKSPDGMSKLDGVLKCISDFRDASARAKIIPRGYAPKTEYMNWYEMASGKLDKSISYSMEQMWDWLRKFPFIGGFTAYEIVTDLRHTALLRGSPDIMTWANAGPGAIRGLNRLHGRKVGLGAVSYVAVCEMRELLDMARGEFAHVWPTREGQPVEMRDIEHTLCEFDKYERTRLGEGKPRGIYR